MECIFVPKVLVDADGCPVIDLTIEIAKDYNLHVILICDTSHRIEREGAVTVLVDKGNDAVDFVLVNRVEKGDIVVTQDYGLAAMVLATKGYAINQNGLVYTMDNIDRLLHIRHISKKARRSGNRVKGPKKRSIEDDYKFAHSFTRLCENVCNNDNNVM
jgi:uncharacterized protein YaiI (UPF0178 family)